MKIPNSKPPYLIILLQQELMAEKMHVFGMPQLVKLLQPWFQFSPKQHSRLSQN